MRGLVKKNLSFTEHNINFGYFLYQCPVFNQRINSVFSLFLAIVSGFVLKLVNALSCINSSSYMPSTHCYSIDHFMLHRNQR